MESRQRVGVSEERISVLLLGRARSRLARSFAHSVFARKKMEFSGVELQVEISIGGQRGLVSHARAGAAAFLISLFSVSSFLYRDLFFLLVSLTLSPSSPILQLRPPDSYLFFLSLSYSSLSARALRFSLVRRRCGCALTRYRVH